VKEERIQETHSIRGRDIAVTVTFGPDWLNTGCTSHLQLQSADKARLTAK